MLQARLTADNHVSGYERLLQKPVKELTFVAFDTETTGRHPMVSGLVEISGVKFRGTGELLEIRTQLINPGRQIPAEVIGVHGITDEMVASKPSFDEVVPPFVQWMKAQQGGVCDDASMNVFLAHNALFDVSFLQVALSKLGVPLPPNPVLDTLKLSRKFVREAKNHRLQTLVEHLGRDDSMGYHRAEADSRHVMGLFLDIVSRIGASCTLADLVNASGVLFFSKPFEELGDLRSACDKRVHKIAQAIDAGADLFLHYRGVGTKYRQITPLSVLYSGKQYYLCAYCHAAGNERTFRVDRISTLELVERIPVGI